MPTGTKITILFSKKPFLAGYNYAGMVFFPLKFGALPPRQVVGNSAAHLVGLHALPVDPPALGAAAGAGMAPADRLTAPADPGADQPAVHKAVA